jgi:hypothetical protein
MTTHAVAPDQIGVFANMLLDQAAALSPKSLHTHSFDPRGVAIDARFIDADYADLCAQRIATSGGPQHEARVSLFVLDAGSLGWADPPALGGDVFDRAQFNATLRVAGLCGTYLHMPRVWQFYSPSRRLGVQLIRDRGALPPWDSGAPLRSFVHWAQANTGLRLCHAASLGDAGKGILIVGAGGSGKSGTTFAGIAHAMTTVGDDYCIVESTDVIRAYPIYRLLKQDPAGISRTFGPDVALLNGSLNWQGKFEITASMLPSSPFVPVLHIGALVVPRIAHRSQCEIARISGAAAMRAFAPSSVFQLPDDEQAGIAFAAAVCRRLPCYELLLSDHASDIAHIVAGLFKTIAT